MARPSNRASTRQQLVEQGIASLRAEGLTVGLDSVSLERAYADAGVARSTAYSAWTDASEGRSPQESFRRAVLQEILENPVHENDFGNTTDALAALDLSGLDGTPEQRRATFREMIRVGAATSLRTIVESWRWLIISALHSSLASVPEQERDQELMASLRRSSEIQLDIVIAEVYGPYLSLARKRARLSIEGGDTMRSFAIAAAALAEGFAPKHIYDPTSPGCVDHYIDDDPRAWSLFGLGIEALIDYFFEDIPEDEQ